MNNFDNNETRLLYFKNINYKIFIFIDISHVFGWILKTIINKYLYTFASSSVDISMIDLSIQIKNFSYLHLSIYNQNILIRFIN
jgi:hypothetical protein